jgi:hypothetical protein
MMQGTMNINSGLLGVKPGVAYGGEQEDVKGISDGAVKDKADNTALLS